MKISNYIACFSLTVSVLTFTTVGTRQVQAEVCEPDDFSAGTDISTACSGVTLSENGNSVFSVFPDSGGTASTGALVFGNSSSFPPEWTELMILRADFTVPVEFVAIDIIANDSFDTGRMRVFDALDNELDIATTAILSNIGTQIERLSISRLSPDIAYATFSGVSGQSVLLDNLAFAVPEPTTDSVPNLL